MRNHPIKLGLLAALALALLWLGFSVTGHPAVLTPDHNAPRILLVKDVRVISMAPGRPQAEEHRTVLIEDGEITGVYGPDDPLEDGQALFIIDGQGLTLLPGLIDAHVHVWDEAELAGYLGHGVTGIRNMSGMPFHLPLAERIEEGRILGPDVLTTGPILNSPGPNQQANHQLVITAAEAKAAVTAQHEDGYRHLKTYSNLTPEAYGALLEAAKTHGMTVAGHTPEGKRTWAEDEPVDFEIAFEDILDDGFITIEHTESIVWHGLRDQLDENAMRGLAEKIAESGTPVTPTLVAHANLIRVAESEGTYLDRPGTETINPVFKMFEQGTYDWWSDPARLPHEAPRADFYLTATRLMAEAGVPLLAGTDAGIFTNIPGESMADEFDLLAEAGLPPYEILRSATVIPAEVLGFERRGQVREGYVANLVLVAGDPLTNIAAMRDVRGVMVRGHWFDEDGLAELREGARQTSRPRTARRVLAMFFSL